jgi:Fe-Mn family superoxide dismutase
MKPSGGGKMPDKFEKKVVKDFGSLDQFKKEFIHAGTTQFGSGWSWLSIKEGKLVISKTANAVNPLIDNMTPILGCDLWEHSYYVDYRNRRPEYLNAFFNNLVNWDFVSSQLDY